MSELIDELNVIAAGARAGRRYRTVEAIERAIAELGGQPPKKPPMEKTAADDPNLVGDLLGGVPFFIYNNRWGQDAITALQRAQKVARELAASRSYAEVLKGLLEEARDSVSRQSDVSKSAAELLERIIAALAKNPNQRQGADSPASATTDPSGEQDQARDAVTTAAQPLNAPLETPGAQSAPATLVRRAIDVLQRHAPPDGLSDREAISALWSIFDSPECREALAKCPTGEACDGPKVCGPVGECLAPAMRVPIENGVRLPATSPDDQLSPIEKFALAVIEQHRDDGHPGDVDGGWLHEAMEKHGLTHQVPVTEPCDDTNCSCADGGTFPTKCTRLTSDVVKMLSLTSPEICNQRSTTTTTKGNAPMSRAPKAEAGHTVLVRTPGDFNGSNVHPGVITHVWSDVGGVSYVNLKVLPDCGAPYDETSINVYETKELGEQSGSPKRFAFWPEFAKRPLEAHESGLG